MGQRLWAGLIDLPEGGDWSLNRRIMIFWLDLCNSRPCEVTFQVTFGLAHQGEGLLHEIPNWPNARFLQSWKINNFVGSRWSAWRKRQVVFLFLRASRVWLVKHLCLFPAWGVLQHFLRKSWLQHVHDRRRWKKNSRKKNSRICPQRNVEEYHEIRVLRSSKVLIPASTGGRGHISAFIKFLTNFVTFFHLGSQAVNSSASIEAKHTCQRIARALPNVIRYFFLLQQKVSDFHTALLLLTAFSYAQSGLSAWPVRLPAEQDLAASDRRL